jgi:hypothetical protein
MRMEKGSREKGDIRLFMSGFSRKRILLADSF